MPNQNEEWIIIGEALHNYFKKTKVVRVNDIMLVIQNNSGALLAKARKEGEREGLEKGKEIIGNDYDSDCKASRTVKLMIHSKNTEKELIRERINKAIKDLKI